MKRPLPPMPPGPWNDAPDLVEFEHAGFPCAIVRHREFGTLNGYVGVPEGHPWYESVGTINEPGINVHGGITYAEPRPPCTVTKRDDGWWWIGFDTAHAGDFVPQVAALLGRGPRYGETWRDLAYVRAETEALAVQARDAGS